MRDSDIKRLQSQVDLLGKLSVSIEGLSNGHHLQDADTLKVDRAVVGQVVTKLQCNEGKPKSSTVPIFNADESIANYTNQESVNLNFEEQRKFDSIIQRIQKLSKLQKSILRLLLEHEGTAMTVPMIATWLSLKESTIRSKPPKDLLNMEFIKRIRAKNGYRYMSLMHSYLHREFPKAKTSILLKQIFE